MNDEIFENKKKTRRYAVIKEVFQGVTTAYPNLTKVNIARRLKKGSKISTFSVEWEYRCGNFN